MSRLGEDPLPPEPAPTDQHSSRLLQAMHELQALDAEKHRVPAHGPAVRDLVRRLEAKAREVFRIAQESETAADGDDRR